MRTIADVDDLNESLQGCLALFAWTTWSLPCHISRRELLAAVDILRQNESCANVDFASVELTAQEGSVWDALLEKLQNQRTIDANAFMFAGAGSVAWICNAHVLDWTVNAAQAGLDHLVERTQSLLCLSRTLDG